VLEKVLDTIKKYNMLCSGDNVVVGVSGGADSMALLHILKRFEQYLDIKVCVAHIHHGIRGQDADKDAEFVHQISKEWGIPFFLKKADIPALSEKWHMSEEETGRWVRYSFFEEVCHDTGANRIALAHHKDDNAETILHNIIRGSGLNGLAGIRAVRDEHVIRPLIEIGRAEIEEYCKEYDICFRHDYTNDDIKYTRNRIRHQLIPYIQENFNPNFTDTLIRMGHIAADDDDFLMDYARGELVKQAIVEDNDIRLPLDILLQMPTAIQRRMIRLAAMHLMGRDYVLELRHIDSIIDLVRCSQVGAVIHLPLELRAIKEYNFFVLRKGVSDGKVCIPPFIYELNIPGEIFVKEIGMMLSAQRVPEMNKGLCSPWHVYIDADSISPPLIIRNRLKGDKFNPLGMKGSKKLKDYFIDRKIPREQRSKVPLVVSGQHILWVVGYQISNSARIQKGTQNIVALEAKMVNNHNMNV
jgi:tRNA(Ile)-lysidine synthase